MPAGVARRGYNRPMRELRQAGSDPAFLRKALSEAGGELRQALAGLRRRELLHPGAPPDEDWTPLGIAVHLRDTELGVIAQLEAILSAREPAIRAVDIDDIPLLEEYRDEELEEVLDDFHYYRRHTAYALWDLNPGDWERGGIHPYRGRMTVLEIAREMYRHDLEHLWQVRRMVGA